MALGGWSLSVAADARTTKCAVYTDADLNHAITTYGFMAPDVQSVGNPDLIRFGVTSSSIGSWQQGAVHRKKEIMYIDTGLTTCGLVYESFEAFIDHLIKTAKSLATQNHTMLFKPHPANDRDLLRKRLIGSGIELVSNEDFLTKLMECEASIVETSSVVLIPALIGMPLLYANYNELKNLKFGSVLTSYPRGYLLRDISEVTDILNQDSSKFDSEALNEWIAHNVGPLPAEEMPARIANIVASMIRERSKSP